MYSYLNANITELINKYARAFTQAELAAYICDVIPKNIPEQTKQHTFVEHNLPNITISANGSLETSLIDFVGQFSITNAMACECDKIITFIKFEYITDGLYKLVSEQIAVDGFCKTYYLIINIDGRSYINKRITKPLDNKRAFLWCDSDNNIDALNVRIM